MRNGIAVNVASNIVLGTPTSTSLTYSIGLLLVGGGGAGGTIKSYGCGGGGGGGAVIEQTLTVTSGTAIALSIGLGGNGSPLTDAAEVGKQDGKNTTFDQLTAKGGAGGAYQRTDDGNQADYRGRNAGGSTGGASGLFPGSVNTQDPYPTLSQVGFVNIGGRGIKNSTNNGAFVAGGGGGAGQAGGDGVSSNASGSYGGKGGDGYISSITGVATLYAAGGGGGLRYSGAGFIRGLGGAGGGGNGGVGSQAGFNATGFGCGGGGCSDTDGTAATVGRSGGSGSAGVIIIAYPNSLPALTLGAGLTFAELATRPGYRVYRITAGSGQITFV